MYFGELATKSDDYRFGHNKAIHRSFDACILKFEIMSENNPRRKYKAEDVVQILKDLKKYALFEEEYFGMGIDEEDVLND